MLRDSMSRCRAVVIVLPLVLAAAPAAAQQASLGVQGDITASNFNGQIDRRLSFICPGSTSFHTIWGTDVYTNDSAVCAAAVHAGILKAGQVGAVTILMGSAAASFQGSLRNGVTSQSYGRWDSSFTFDRSSEPGRIDWNTTAQYIPAAFTDPIKVICPPRDRTSPRVWGTDIYTDDSFVCFAAVHAGAISAEAGGKISVSRVAGQAAYAAAERNGVASSSWGPWTSSFNVVATPVMIAVRGPTTPAVTTGPRTDSCPPGTMGTTCTAAANAHNLILAGFTASGTSLTVEPHLVTLAGFTASGTSLTTVPHTLTLTGFAASGASVATPPHTITLAGWTGTGP